MKAEELIQLVNEHSISDFYNEDIPEELIAQAGPVVLKEFTGGEGNGEESHLVIEFPEHNVFLRADGGYWSYHGYDYDDAAWYEVVPVTVEVIEYKPKR